MPASHSKLNQEVLNIHVWSVHYDCIVRAASKLYTVTTCEYYPHALTPTATVQFQTIRAMQNSDLLLLDILQEETHI